jgi:protein-L-isoaspartate(D-aspartate) O-methyltransferase
VYHVANGLAAGLRGNLADDLVTRGLIVSPQVEAAFRAVPRHLFAPGADLEEAYADDIVVVKRDEYGTTISSVSAPNIQALMLEQAALRPGMRVLEIGSGGYNAALCAEIVGDTGQVTTIDIDGEVTQRASCCLGGAGYTRVRVAQADGELGYPDGAPYDRILVTAGAWDIPTAWGTQLSSQGIITVPLRMRGNTRSVTLRREGDHYVATSSKLCGFVAMQGAGQHQEELLLLRGKEIGLRIDDGPIPDPRDLDLVLDGPRHEMWTTVMVGPMEPFESLYLWLATELPGSCQLSVDPDLATGVVSPQNPRADPALTRDGSLAYLALRKSGDRAWEFGVHAFGPHAVDIAQEMTDAIRAWDHTQRTGSGAIILVYPIAVTVDQLPAGCVITKQHNHIIISWPQARAPA